jgi:small GTP-binding protein
MIIQKKICMIGAFATGKTSLVAKFVHGIFSEKYHTTVGVKIDKKVIDIQENKLKLIVWDLYGEDEFQKVRMSYLRGCAGYLLVVDGTRHNTLEKAFDLQTRVEDSIGQVPFILVMNKWDIIDEWEIESSEIDDVIDKGWTVIKTSAKNGVCVEELFQTIAKKILDC